MDCWDGVSGGTYTIVVSPPATTTPIHTVHDSTHNTHPRSQLQLHLQSQSPVLSVPAPVLTLGMLGAGWLECVSGLSGVCRNSGVSFPPVRLG